MKLLSALCFPLRRPARLAALALAQSLFVWLIIAAFDAAYRPYTRHSEFETFVMLFLVFGSALFNAFWLRSSSVASLKRVIAGQNSLAPLHLSQFRPGGIGPAITSLALMFYFVLFLGLTAMPDQVSNFMWRLRVMTPVEARDLVASYVLVIGPVTFISLIFFVSLACHAAASVGLHIGGRSADLFHPRKHLATTVRFLSRQFLLFGFAAIAFNLGLQLEYAIMPSGLGETFVDPLATGWWMFVVFLCCAVPQYFWHVCLYLLADYVLDTGV